MSTYVLCIDTVSCSAMPQSEGHWKKKNVDNLRLRTVFCSIFLQYCEGKVDVKPGCPKYLNLYVYLLTVDCVWEEWSSWEACNVTCGLGHQLRHRGRQAEQHGGQPCPGPEVDGQDCFPKHCPCEVITLIIYIYACKVIVRKLIRLTDQQTFGLLHTIWFCPVHCGKAST